MKVLFFVAMMLGGQERPIVFEHPVEDVETCLYEAYKFAANPSNQLLIRGGQLQVGCTVTYEKSEEH